MPWAFHFSKHLLGHDYESSNPMSTCIVTCFKFMWSICRWQKGQKPLHPGKHLQMTCITLFTLSSPVKFFSPTFIFILDLFYHIYIIVFRLKQVKFEIFKQ